MQAESMETILRAQTQQQSDKLYYTPNRLVIKEVKKHNAGAYLTVQPNLDLVSNMQYDLAPRQSNLFQLPTNSS